MITTKKVEELGFTLFQTSSWSREDLSRMSMIVVPHTLFGQGFSAELVIGEQDVWQLFIGEEDKVQIVHATISDSSIGFLDLEKGITDKRKMMQFNTVFAGKIKSDDDLVKVLELVECPFKLIKD